MFIIVMMIFLIIKKTTVKEEACSEHQVPIIVGGQTANTVGQKQAYLILDVWLTVTVGVNVQQPNDKCNAFERKPGAFFTRFIFLIKMGLKCLCVTLKFS